MTSETQAGRVSGLDTLRALAILLVLVAHCPKPEAGVFTRMLNFGWTGVDLFFVLSGYLIGGQWFRALARGEQVSLIVFYARRFLRTLPTYYVVLGVYAALPVWAAAAGPEPLWKFAGFLQNFGVPAAFSPSWSLCVEEHFYLLFPVAALALARANRPRLAWGALAGILILSLAVRTAIWLAVRPDLLAGEAALRTYMGSLYFPTYCRLDGITLGVGLAALKQFRPAAWERLLARGNQLLGGSAVLLAAAAGAFWQRYSFACSAAGFTLISLAFALLVASALGERSWLGRVRVPGAQYVALLSYSIYLTHSLALDCAGRLAPRLGAPLPSLAGAALAAGLAGLFAHVLYYGVERPCLALRDRLFGAGRDARWRRAQLAVSEAR